MKITSKREQSPSLLGALPSGSNLRDSGAKITSKREQSPSLLGALPSGSNLRDSGAKITSKKEQSQARPGLPGGSNLRGAKNRLLSRIALISFIISLFILGFVLAKNVLMPFAVSVFFAYLLYPLAWKIEKNGVHRAVSILIAILVTIAIVGSIVLFLSVKLSDIHIDFSDLKRQFDEKTGSAFAILEEKFGLQSETMRINLEKAAGTLFSSGQSGIGKIFTTTTTTVFQILILPVYTFFLLLYRTKTAWFIFMLAGRRNRQKAVHILRQISTVTTKYLTGLLVVVFILSILNTTGLYLIGVPHALLFGISAAVLNLIPFVGTFLGGIIPVLFVLFTFPNPLNTVLQVALLFIIVQLIENNFLTPTIVGNNVKLNPFAIILSLLFANMIWGIVGMLIVIPSLAILKIIMQNIDELKPFAYLISDRGNEKHRVKVYDIVKSLRGKFSGLWTRISLHKTKRS